MKASHELWCGLCHQHAYISSAALPSLMFILEVLDNANDELALEILDIIWGFAICTDFEPATPHENWQSQLRKHIETELPRFERLASHPNEELSEFAQYIVSNLTAK